MYKIMIQGNRMSTCLSPFPLVSIPKKGGRGRALNKFLTV